MPRSPSYVPRDVLVQPGAWDADDPEIRSGIEPRVATAVRLQQRRTDPLTHLDPEDHGFEEIDQATAPPASTGPPLAA